MAEVTNMRTDDLKKARKSISKSLSDAAAAMAAVAEDIKRIAGNDDEGGKPGKDAWR